MAQTIKLKRSATQNAVPSTSSLELGEIAINTYDGKLFIKKNVSGTESIVTIGEVGAGSIGPTELASTAVTAGSYGSTSAIPVITIDADGRITSASTATISGLSANSVTSTEIAANAVGISELDVSDGTNGQVLSTDGSGTLSFVDQSGGAASATAFSTNIASGDGSTTAFTLSESPSAESKIIAFINGVFQNQDAYTISGTTLTFDTAPISGTNNVVVYVVGDVYSGESVLISNFSGNGTTTAFTLSNNPGNENNTQVYIDGVYQQKTTYSVSGTTLTFSSAPPTGTNNIEVVMLTSTTVNTPAAGSVVTASMADDSVTASKIVSSAVTTAKIADSNVTTAKIADDAVTIGKIADAALVIESEGIGSNDNDTTLPTSAAVKDYVDTQVAGKDALSELSGDTDDVTEGSTNLYYTDARVGTYISGNRTYGNITTTGYIAGPSTFTIDPAAVGDNTGTLVIAGNLQVDGTTTTINSTTMEVDDLNITLASGAANAAAANGAGITVDGASATITYDGTNDEWDFNKDINVTGNIATQSGGLTVGVSDTTAGVITVHGGATGNNEGGEIRLQTSADHDGTYDFYRIDVVEDDFRIGREGTTDLTINSSGNATFAGNISGNRISTSDGVVDTGQAGSATIFNESGSTADFRIESTDKTYMFFLDGGLNRIGINTGTPSHTLHILNEVSSDTIDENNGLVKMQSSGGNGMIFGTIASSPYTSYIQSAYVQDTSIAQYNLALNPIGGNVGIGKTDPSAKLHIEVADNTEFLKATITGNESWAFKGASVAGTSTDTVSFGLSGSTQCMTWQEDGNVGINNINPDEKLHISGGGIKVDGEATIASGSGTGVFLDYASNVGRITALDQGTAWRSLRLNAADIQFYIANGERMLIDSSGKVIIGDTASHTDDLLQIETPASGGGHGIQIRRNDSNNDQGIGHIQFGNNTDTDLAKISAKTDGSTDNARLVFSTQPNGGSSTERMTILESGNVVVGDNSLIGSKPTGSKLNIFGDGVTLRFDGGSNSTKSILFRGTSAGNPGEVYADGGLRLRTEDANMPIYFLTNSTGSNNERMRIDSYGVRLEDGAMAYEQNRPLFSGANASSYSTSTNLAYTKETQQYSVTGEAFKARVRARAYTKYVHMKTNLSSDNIMFFFRIYGYFYNYGVNESVRGGYTYQSGVITESVANAYNANSSYTIGDFYRSSSGNFLCVRLDVHQTGYTEGEALVFFGSHSNTVTRELEITDMQHRDDGNNAY